MYGDILLDKDDSGISITRISQRVSTLTIDSVTANHRALYTCTAGNKAGKVNQSASLEVNGILICMPRYYMYFVLTFPYVATHP